MRKADRIASLVLLTVSVYYVYCGNDYGLQAGGVTGPGFVPFWVGLLLGFLSLIQLIGTFRRTEEVNGEKVDIFDRCSLKSCALYIGGSAAAVFAARFLGLIIPIMVLVLLFNKLQGKDSWKKSILLAVTTAAGIYLLFAVALGVPVPTLFL